MEANFDKTVMSSIEHGNIINQNWKVSVIGKVSVIHSKE